MRDRREGEGGRKRNSHAVILKLGQDENSRKR
jgi:hypothetical protein